MKQLSIIIVNYNVVHFLDLCLDSVFAAIVNFDAEIIVVDNASTDGSCEMVKNKYPKVALVANKNNVGFAKANNQGVAIAQGTYICILNPDTVLGETIFDEVYAFAKAQSTQIGAIGVRLVDGTGKFLPECKRNLPTPRVAFQKFVGSGDDYYARSITQDKIGKIEVLVGAFMFMKKAVYAEAGGFDERYFMYGEDIDLSYTISTLGYDNYYLGTVTAIHFKGESTVKDAVYRKRFYNAMHIFYNKHLKRNFLEGAFVNAGLWCARKCSSTLSKKEKQSPNHPRDHILIGKNEALTASIENVVNTKVVFHPEMEDASQNTQYLFDMKELSYKQCIKYMLDNREANLTFKFIPKNSTFAIGSNSSKGRGEFIKW